MNGLIFLPPLGESDRATLRFMLQLYHVGVLGTECTNVGHLDIRGIPLRAAQLNYYEQERVDVEERQPKIK